MITNFEEITSEITEDEMLIADILIKSLSKVTKDKAVSGSAIVDKFNNGGIREYLNINWKLRDGRLRKIINYIRYTGKLPILSNSKGYYVSYDQSDIVAQINSLNERAAAINHAADGLKTFLNK